MSISGDTFEPAVIRSILKGCVNDKRDFERNWNENVCQCHCQFLFMRASLTYWPAGPEACQQLEEEPRVSVHKCPAIEVGGRSC
jgi:hypothetical protein